MNERIERVGEAYEGGQKLTVIGRKLQVGEVAPDFVFNYLDQSTGEIYCERLNILVGSVVILSWVNSLFTPVCQNETLQWDTFLGDLPSDVGIYTIGMDTIFAQAEWKRQHPVKHEILSAYEDHDSVEEYGVLIVNENWHIPQRAVFVIGKNGKIVYCEYVEDQAAEPDYDAAIEAANRAAEA